MLDAWLDLHELTYKSLLKLHENLLFNALRYEGSLSDVTKMVNKNKYVLRNGIVICIPLSKPLSTTPLLKPHPAAEAAPAAEGVFGITLLKVYIQELGEILKYLTGFKIIIWNKYTIVEL